MCSSGSGYWGGTSGAGDDAACCGPGSHGALAGMWAGAAAAAGGVEAGVG